MNEDESTDSNTVDKGERFIDNTFLKNMEHDYLLFIHRISTDDILKDDKKDEKFDIKKRPLMRNIIYIDKNDT